MHVVSMHAFHTAAMFAAGWCVGGRIMTNIILYYTIICGVYNILKYIIIRGHYKLIREIGLIHFIWGQSWEYTSKQVYSY